MSGVEREPLTITLPHGATVWLVAAHCEPLAIRPTREEAEQLCETAERATLADPDAATFTWWAVDAEDADDGPHELYITVSGDEHRTEYTVTPIYLRQEQPPDPADDGDRLTPATTRWDEAIDWLLNSRYTADPDIQAAFWGVVDGRCTVEEADRGNLADGTPLSDLPQEEA